MLFAWRTRWLGWVFLGVVALAACGRRATPVLVSGHALNPDPWLSDEQAIRQRAAFDMQCDPAQIAISVLEAGGVGYWPDWATQVGTVGCGAQIVYVRTFAGWIADTWRGVASEQATNSHLGGLRAAEPPGDATERPARDAGGESL